MQTTVVCKNCGHKITVTVPTSRVEQKPTRDGGVILFERASALNGSAGLRAVTPDISNLMVEPLYRTIAFSLPLTVFAIVATEYGKLSPLVPPLVFCVSFGLLMSKFSKFLTWDSPLEQPDSDPDDESEDEPESAISTETLAWTDVQPTTGGVRLRALIVPNISDPSKHIPVRIVQRFAIAVVNNGMAWVDERDLAGVGRTAYRSIREGWIERGYAVRTPDKKTQLTEHGKIMTRKVAMTQPE